MDAPTFPLGTPQRAAEAAWEASLTAAEEHAAAYLVAAFPALKPAIGDDGTPRPTYLRFTLPSGGKGDVIIADPHRATIEGTGLTRQECAALIPPAFFTGHHFAPEEGEGACLGPDDIHHAPPGAYWGFCAGRGVEDKLYLDEDGTGELSLYRLEMHVAAQALAALATRR